MSDFRFYIGDVETTGLAKDAGIVEVALIEIDEDLQVLDRAHSLIDPQMPISPSASGIHSITAVDVAEAPTIEEWFDDVLGQRLEGDGILIAHNAGYDERFLAPWFTNFCGTICTLRLARKYVKDSPDHKLSTLMYHLDLVRGTSHRADGDVETTLDLLRKLVEISGLSLRELGEEAAKPIFVEKMPFGKHKGKPVREVPKGWITWLFAQTGEVDRDLRHTLEMVLAGTAPELIAA